MGEIEALYRKVYFANSMDQILKETILIMLRQMIIGVGGTVPDLSNYPTKSEMQLFVGDAVSTKVDLSDFNIQIGTINTSLTNKLESTDLQPIRSDLSTLSGTVNTKVSLDTFNGSIANLDGKISDKVDVDTFNSEVSTINTELTKKLETVDFSEVNNRIDVVDGKVINKVDTSTFNNQITVTNNKISTDIATARRSTMEEVNRDYLPRAEYADLGIQFFDADKQKETRDFKIFSKTVTTIESGIWECDFSEAGFNYPPQIFVTAHARNKGEAAGDAAYATIIPMYTTESYARGRLSSASSAGLLAAMVSVAADGDVTVVAIGQ